MSFLRGHHTLVAIGVTHGAGVRLLQHTIYELNDRGAGPDFIGGFVTVVP